MRAEGEEVGEPDWEQEMSIFKRRTLKPSQLEALRKLEAEKVDVGRVSAARACRIINRSVAPPAAALFPAPADAAACLPRARPPVQVLYSTDSIAIVEGLNNDADVGTALSFSSGAIG